jgi:hypothetical protein
LISFIEDMGFVVLFTFLWGPEGLGKKNFKIWTRMNKDGTKSNNSQAFLYSSIMYRLLLVRVRWNAAEN